MNWKHYMELFHLELNIQEIKYLKDLKMQIIVFVVNINVAVAVTNKMKI